jgi:hypothetical protein
LTLPPQTFALKRHDDKSQDASAGFFRDSRDDRSYSGSGASAQASDEIDEIHFFTKRPDFDRLFFRDQARQLRISADSKTAGAFRSQQQSLRTAACFGATIIGVEYNQILLGKPGPDHLLNGIGSCPAYPNNLDAAMLWRGRRFRNPVNIINIHGGWVILLFSKIVSVS